MDDEVEMVAIDPRKMQRLAEAIRDTICDKVFDGDETLINTMGRELNLFMRERMPKEDQKKVSAMVAAFFHSFAAMIDALPEALEGTGIVKVLDPPNPWKKDVN